MLTITDLKGDEHVLTCIKTRKKELNGNDELQLIIHQQQNRSVSLIDVSEMWIINYQTVKFKIVYLERVTRGNSFYLNVRAIPLFYDEFATSIIHYVENGSITATEAFTKIFAGTNFNFILGNNAYAVSWDGFGKGQTRLELFKKAIDKFGYEFYIEGNTVYLEALVGNDTNFMYKYKLNASDVKQSVDATGLFTHIKGFGDLPEDYKDYLSEAKLKREYTSDLANLIGIREAPPVIDGRVKTVETLDKMLAQQVENSLNVSVTAKLHDLRKQGYDVGVPVLGDRTFLIDERINVNIEIRVYALEEKYDEKDNLKDCKITFGSQGIVSRQVAKINDISKAMMDILYGRVQLPFSILDSMAQDMLQKIKSVSTELILDNGIFAVDKNNPNNIFGLNSAGWFISTDGGKTATTIATADGIVANAITSGSINTNLVRVMGNDADKYIAIENDQLTSYGTYDRTWRGVSGTYETYTRIKSGYIRIRNDSLDRSMYYTDFGISTYLDGTGDNSASGTLAFFDTTYSTARGVTLHSTMGVVALRSEQNRVILDANQTVNIESDTASVYVRPMKDNRTGINEFRFWIKDNDSFNDTDGVLSFGNITGTTTVSSSGIRLSKSADSIVYATNNNGDIGSGDFYARNLYGDWITKVDNLYAHVNNELRVIDKKVGYNGGNPTYREVRASNFITSSSEKYKENIIKSEINATKLMRNTVIYEYNMKGDAAKEKRLGLIVERETPEILVKDDSIIQYNFNSLIAKYCQELDERISVIENERIS